MCSAIDGTDVARHRRPKEGQAVYRNSAFVLASTATTAALGFLFWVVVARFYTPAEVGIATSLISAMSLISYLSLFGLNNTLIRFPAASDARNAQLTLALCAVAAAGGLLALGYLAGLPWYGEKLLFVRENPLAVTTFAVLCAFAALNQLAKSVFMGARAPELNVWSDGLTQGVAKLALPASLTGFGMYGIVGSTGAGFAAAVLCALFLMRQPARLPLRPAHRRHPAARAVHLLPGQLRRRAAEPAAAADPAADRAAPPGRRGDRILLRGLPDRGPAQRDRLLRR